MEKATKPLECRKAVMRLLVQMDYQPENNDRSIQSIYDRLGKYLSGITYKTFDNYQNEDGELSHEELPEAVVLGLWLMLKLSHQTNKIVYPPELQKRLSEPILPRKKRGKQKNSEK